MVIVKSFCSVEELWSFRQLACSVPEEVQVQESEGNIRADAKSLINLFALDYSRPVRVITSSPEVIGWLRN